MGMAGYRTTIWSHHNLGAKQMDFIERWFGVSPDGGDGSLELLWIVAIVLGLVVIAFRRKIANWLSSWKARHR
jgi:hypothetical protein